jgi:hypothetical protein
MSKTSSPALSESGRLHGIAPLAVVIATNLASAHSTGQYLAGLAALALALAHDTLTHRLLAPAAERTTSDTPNQRRHADGSDRLGGLPHRPRRRNVKRLIAINQETRRRAGNTRCP